jgi:hypothetical protein
MYLLPGLRRNAFRRQLPQLRRRIAAPPDPPGRQARGISRHDRAPVEAASGLRRLKRWPVCSPRIGIVLAGTDLNLAFDGQQPGYAVIDALDVHVDLLAELATRQPPHNQSAHGVLA